MDARREATLLRAAVADLGTPTRAKGAKAYMRSELAFTGTSVPHVRKVARTWLRNHRHLDAKGLRVVAETLWGPDVFETRLLAAVLLRERLDLLAPRDLAWLERLVRASRAWALLDTFVPYALAAVLAQAPALRRRTLTRWAKDGDFWMRRTALLTMHRDLARGNGDWPLWTKLAATQLEDQPRWTKSPPTAEERFFIRKALGWVLRDRAKKHPDDVVAFVRDHRDRMAGLTLREATRGLPSSQRIGPAP